MADQEPTDEIVEKLGAVREDAVEVAQEIVEVVKGFSTPVTVGLSLFSFGLGAVGGYFLARRMLKTKYAKIADAEIEEMRQHYRERDKAREAAAAKRPLHEIVEEQGYSSPATEASAPMAVPPPRSVVESEEANAPEPTVRNVFREQEEERKAKHAQRLAAIPPWDYHEERKKRSPDRPYVIHYDEILEADYEQVDLHYYEGDNVVCGDNDEVMDLEDREENLGEANLDRFGHGSGDPNIVYIRNDKLGLVYSIDRNDMFYLEDVHGIKHSSNYKNLERMRVRERDESEE